MLVGENALEAAGARFLVRPVDERAGFADDDIVDLPSRQPLSSVRPSQLCRERYDVFVETRSEERVEEPDVRWGSDPRNRRVDRDPGAGRNIVDPFEPGRNDITDRALLTGFSKPADDTLSRRAVGDAGGDEQDGEPVRETRGPPRQRRSDREERNRA
jgi:hypothetical protein